MKSIMGSAQHLSLPFLQLVAEAGIGPMRKFEHLGTQGLVYEWLW